ncbi:hypothetical protein ACL02T_08510 [Pseudonocardia sp. RS010]|uniref:hypothetical protein n=1 Tax=Pseudonocardia sp. RS010 TaxID=3385979 RepID=UPI00399FDEAF
MSLLDRGTDVVTVFPEEPATDQDGNPIVRASAVGIVARATVQPLGTSTEDQNAVGYVPNAPTRYRVRFSRADEQNLGTLGRATEIEWNGERWSLLGDPVRYGGSRRTAHTDYTIGRL